MWRWLAGSIILGAALGLLFGELHYRDVLVVPDWQQLFSMGGFTFNFFWTFVGAAVGLLVGGGGVILLAPRRTATPDSVAPATEEQSPRS